MRTDGGGTGGGTSCDTSSDTSCDTSCDGKIRGKQHALGEQVSGGFALYSKINITVMEATKFTF